MKSIRRKINQAIEEDILLEYPKFNKENILSKIEFGDGEPKKTRFKKPILIQVAYSLALIIITAILSISIYSVTSHIYNYDDNIVLEANKIFTEELKQYPRYELLQMISPDKNTVIGIYSCDMNNNKEYKLLCYRKRIGNYSIIFNNQEFIIDEEVEAFDIVLEEDNDIKLFKGEVVVFTTNFTNE